MNALTIYILVSLSFVIATIIEFAILLIIDRRSPATNKSSVLKVRMTTRKTFAIGSRELYVDKDMESEKMPNIHETFYSSTEKIDF